MTSLMLLWAVHLFKKSVQGRSLCFQVRILASKTLRVQILPQGLGFAGVLGATRPATLRKMAL